MDPGRHVLARLVWRDHDESTLAAAAASVDDWPALIAQARNEGLLGLMAARLTEARPAGLPTDVLEQLQRLRTAGAERALRMSGQMVRILTLLDRHGIDALPIKGPVLAQDLYGDATVRHSSDLDVVVRRTDVRAARALLLEHGFADASPHNPDLLERGPRMEGEIVLRRSDGGLVVDLHWRAIVGGSDRVPGVDRLLAGARSLPFLNGRVLAPSVIDQLLVTVLHGGHHQWRPLELRLAVAVQVERLSAATWPGICAAARDVGCLRRLAAGVAHACEPFGVHLPAEIRCVLAADRIAASYLDYLRRSARSCREPSATRDLVRIWWDVRSEDCLSATLDALLMRTVYPTHEDWEAVRLPDGLEGLYWVVRPVRLGTKYARVLISSTSAIMRSDAGR